MNAGTCWGKNTIGPSGRGVEKPREVTLTLTFLNSRYIITYGHVSLTAGIRSEKCIVRRFRHCANIIECTYTNPDSTV
jgi:hypothetical protein